jgi:hypothetical protein
MSNLPSYETLRTRFDEYQAANLERAALAQALEQVGWTGGQDAVGIVAALAPSIIDACVSGHRDVAMAANDLADLMRAYAPRRDNSLAPVAAFLPVAEELLRVYVAGDTPQSIRSLASQTGR